MKKKLISIALACTMATSMVVGATACTDDSSDALKISVVNVGYGANWAHKLAEAYMASHEGVTIEVDDTYTGGLDKEFVNELNGAVPHYDFKTENAAIFGGKDGYIQTKEFVLNDIKEFIAEVQK